MLHIAWLQLWVTCILPSAVLEKNVVNFISTWLRNSFVPAGYVYLLFESDKSVKSLLLNCTHDVTTNECFFRLSSRRMRSKEVQVINVFCSPSYGTASDDLCQAVSQLLKVVSLYGLRGIWVSTKVVEPFSFVSNTSIKHCREMSYVSGNVQINYCDWFAWCMVTAVALLLLLNHNHAGH